MATLMRTFTLSCDTFGGFSKRIDINSCDSVDDIIQIIVNHLRNHLQQGNLECLVRQLEGIKPLYHIHDYQFGHILLSDVSYYICNHGCNPGTVETDFSQSTMEAVGAAISRGSS